MLSGLVLKAQVLDGVYVRDVKGSVTILGVVKGASSKQPLDNVIISVFGSDGTNLKMYSDFNGNFMCFLRVAKYKLKYEKKSYTTLNEDIEFAHVPDTIKVVKYLELEK